MIIADKPYRACWHRLLAFGMLLHLAASSAAAPAGGAQGPAPLYLPTGVIFSEQAARDDGLCRAGDCWMPTIAEIRLLEQDLAAFLAHSTVEGARDILRNRARYKHKYAGHEKQGRRFILVNGLCTAFWKEGSPNLLHTRRPATDMGSCYFMVDYDVARRRFLRFYVDGEA